MAGGRGAVRRGGRGGVGSGEGFHPRAVPRGRHLPPVAPRIRHVPGMLRCDICALRIGCEAGAQQKRRRAAAAGGVCVFVTVSVSVSDEIEMRRRQLARGRAGARVRRYACGRGVLAR